MMSTQAHAETTAVGRTGDPAVKFVSSMLRSMPNTVQSADRTSFAHVSTSVYSQFHRTGVRFDSFFMVIGNFWNGLCVLVSWAAEW